MSLKRYENLQFFVIEYIDYSYLSTYIPNYTLFFEKINFCGVVFYNVLKIILNDKYI